MGRGLNKGLIYFVTFFSFSGYYIGLAILAFFSLNQYSRLYSIPLRLLTTVFMIMIIYYNLRYYEFFRNRNELFYLRIFCLFWGLYFVKVFIADYKFDLRMEFYEYIFYSINFAILPFITYFTTPMVKYKNLIINALIVSGFFLGLVSIFFYWNYLMLGIGRLSMIQYVDDEIQTLSPLALSYSGSLTIGLVIYKLINFKNSSEEKTFLYLTLLVSIFMFYIGASRGSVFALFLTLPFFLIYSREKIKMLLLGLLLIVLLFLGAIYSGSSVFERTETISEDIDSGSNQSGRIILWKQAYSHIKTSVFFGDRIELVKGGYPHNIFLEVLMATGVIGFSLFMIVLIRGFSLGFSLSKYRQNNVWVLLFFIQGFIQYMFTGALWNTILLFMPLGIIFSYSQNKISLSNQF